MNTSAPGSRCGGLILSMDQGCLTVDTSLTLELYQQISACIGCPLIFSGEVVGSRDFVVNGVYNTELSIGHCNYTYLFGEGGKYLLNFSESTNPCPEIEVLIHPHSDLSLWLIFGFVAMFFMISLCYRIFRSAENLNLAAFVRERFREDLSSSDISGDADRVFIVDNLDVPLISSRNKPRMGSIDLFRGITVFLMIFVNAGGGGLYYFQHSVWDGVTIADLVFPWFAWIMGASILPSVFQNMRATMSTRKVFFKIVYRSIVLILLGLVISNKDGPIALSHMRLPGVLQRLGIAYFVVASFVTITYPIRLYVRKRLMPLLSLILIMLLMVIHICITNYLPVPGCPTGYVGPGGISDGAQFINCTGGAAGYIDQLVLTKNHLYTSGPWTSVYSITVPYDPEGLLGILTTSALVLRGLELVYMCKTNLLRSRDFLIFGFIDMTMGICMSHLKSVYSVSDWLPGSWIIPINKPLWSPSFVVIAMGSAEILFFLCILLTKSSGDKWFFTALGRNSLFIFVGSTLLAEYLPFSWYPVSHGNHIEPLVIALWQTLLWTFIAVKLHNKEIYLTI